MSCSTCTRTKPIPTCIDELTLGGTDVNDTAVYVYLKNLATGQLQRASETTTAAGLVTVDMTKFKVSENYVYSVWVTLQTATDLEDYKQLTIGATAYDCLEIRFSKSWTLVDGESEVAENSVTQILAIEA